MSHRTLRAHVLARAPAPARGLARLALALALAALPAAAQQVLVVAADGSGDHGSIQSAIDASGESDVVLVRSGSYGGFDVMGRSATVVADVGATVELVWGVNVMLLGADDRVLLHGLHIDDPEAPLWVFDCDGPVWVQEGSLTVQDQGDTTPGMAAHCQGADTVQFVHVRMEAHDAKGPVPGSGGVLRVQSSNASLYDCLVQGISAGDGQVVQAGVVLESGGLFVSGSIVRGTPGNDGDTPVAPATCEDGWDGGAALKLAYGTARVLDAALVGGAGGQASGWMGCTDGDDGAPWQLMAGGAIDVLPGTARVLTIDAVLREGETGAATLSGVPGELAWLLVGLGDLPALAPSPVLHGVFGPGVPWLPLPVGVIPSSGTLSGPIHAGTLPAGVDALRLDVQPVLGGTGNWTLGSPRMLWMVRAGT